MSTSVQPTSSASSVQPSVTPQPTTPACPSTDKVTNTVSCCTIDYNTVISKSPSSTFPIIFKSPTDCERSSCTFYWAMGPNTANSQYLDVYMEGTVDGWLAVGFSHDQAMVSAVRMKYCHKTRNFMYTQEQCSH